MNNMIKNYINILKKEDIYKFGIKNNIELSDNEVDTLYYIVKNEYDSLINDDESVFINYKNKFSNGNYEKIKILFYEYKKRYQNYL